MRKRIRFLLFSLLGLAVLFAGCKGEDGTTMLLPGGSGASGEAGVPGTDGGFVAEGDELCSLCHSGASGTALAYLGDAHDPLVAHPIRPDVTVTGLTLNTSPIKDQMTFTVSGGVDQLSADQLRVYVADIVGPTDYVTTGTTYTDTASAVTHFENSYLERWAYERGSGGSGYVAIGTLTGGPVAYTYEFTTDLNTIDTARAPDGDVTHPQRIMMRVATDDDPSYARTVAIVDVADFNGIGGYSPTVNGNYAAQNLTRTVVDGRACQKCHNDPLEKAAHGSSYQTPQGCNICHSPIGNDYGDRMQNHQAYLPSLIHRLHSGQNWQWDFSGVAYPQKIADCQDSCHDNSYGQTQSAEWLTPKIEICTQCHTTTTFGASPTHTGGSYTNGNCVGGPCHGSGNTFDVAVVHPNAVKPQDEFDVNITSSCDPCTKANYYGVGGDKPTITIKLYDPGTTTHANTNFYSSTTVGAKGNDTDDFLSTCSMRFYGPRSKAVPILIPGWDNTPPTQSLNLITSTFSGINRTATGWEVTFDAPPPSIPDGTYMISAECGDYGYVLDTDQKPNSAGLLTIQIGASGDLKVSGDGCVNCHGNHRMHASGSHAHNVPFDTDRCLGCHDYSNNYGEPIANRVHAIHNANSQGELHNYDSNNVLVSPLSRDWSHIEYPQSIENCDACHTTASTVWKEDASSSAWCMGCHYGDNRVGTNDPIDHMRSQGFPYKAQ